MNFSPLPQQPLQVFHNQFGVGGLRIQWNEETNEIQICTGYLYLKGPLNGTSSVCVEKKWQKHIVKKAFPIWSYNTGIKYKGWVPRHHGWRSSHSAFLAAALHSTDPCSWVPGHWLEQCGNRYGSLSEREEIAQTSWFPTPCVTWNTSCLNRLLRLQIISNKERKSDVLF